MQITIEINCPHCHSGNINRNGRKSTGRQNYVCKDCGRQFIAEHERIYNGGRVGIVELVTIMLVWGIGIRDIGAVLKISLNKVLKILKRTKHRIKPSCSHYDALEIDEFWTYVGKKANKVWLIYAYHRESGEIVAYVWGKRDLKTAKKLRKRINRLGITYDRIATDNWDSFLAAFALDLHDVGKQYTVGIEGNNCRLRHRIRRAFRRTCCFSKKILYHWKAFELAFFYINYGYV